MSQNCVNFQTHIFTQIQLNSNKKLQFYASAVDENPCRDTMFLVQFVINVATKATATFAKCCKWSTSLVGTLWNLSQKVNKLPFTWNILHGSCFRIKIVQWINNADEQKYRQYNRFHTPDTGFEEGPTKWSFVGFPSTSDDIKDILLEVALIILTRSQMNSILNLTEYLNKNSRLKNSYSLIRMVDKM